MRYICDHRKGCWQKKCLHINLHKRDPNGTYCDSYCQIADRYIECISINEIRKEKINKLESL